MISKLIFFCLFLVTQLWAQDAANANMTTPNPIPTLKETEPRSAEEWLLNGLFDKELYAESQGFSESAYWHKITFPKNDTQEHEQQVYLTLSYYIIEQLDFYLFHDEQLKTHWKRGALQDWKTDTDQYEGIWIPITLSSQHDTSLLIRKQGNHPLLTPIILLKNQEASAQKKQKLIFWTFIISSLSILMIYNVFLFLLLKQSGFIYYLGLNFVILIALSAITGFNRWIFPEEISQWIIKNLFVIFGIGTWILFRFSIYFLQDAYIPNPSSLIRKYGDWIFIIFLFSYFPHKYYQSKHLHYFLL
jgi:diguanylate cyclase